MNSLYLHTYKLAWLKAMQKRDFFSDSFSLNIPSNLFITFLFLALHNIFLTFSLLKMVTSLIGDGPLGQSSRCSEDVLLINVLIKAWSKAT